jgi:hypothetical protein
VDYVDIRPDGRLDEDALVEALTRVARGEYAGAYVLDPATGDYSPQGYQVCFEEFFSFH